MSGNKDGLTNLTPDVEEPIVDIVFVHGLTGDRLTTWTKNQILWPQEILAKDKYMSKARILTWGYDSAITRFWTKTPEQDIDAYARDLCTDLSAMRHETNTETVPIIFVMHSLGGLVCEEALLLGRVHPDQSIKSIGDCTRGMIFLGTPHGGSSLALWANIGLTFAKVVWQVNKRNVRLLEKDSEKLAKIGENFPLLLSDRQNERDTRIMVACFFETLKMDGVGIVVDEKSATLSGYRKQSIPADHVEMCKFTHDRDVGYLRVKGVLAEMLRSLVTEEKKENVKIEGHFEGVNYGNAAGVITGGQLSSQVIFNNGQPRSDEGRSDNSRYSSRHF